MPMDPISLIALSLGAGWASGLNLYAAVLTLGGLYDLGWIGLPPDLQVLGSPVVLATAAMLYVLEFGADKIPLVNTGWDALHTFIRIPAGALLAASSVADLGPEWTVAAALAGGSLAAGTHFAKAGSRALLATLPIPFLGFGASLGEDLAAVLIIWLAFAHPIALLVLLALFVALLIWLLPKLVRGIGALLRFFTRSRRGPDAPGTSP
jgi:Domain of unknown function (DUF4126)